MKLQYLGTAAAEGWPGMFCRCAACNEARKRRGKNLRTRSQAILDDRILIDFPPDTYMHILQHGLDLTSIKTCLITHTHSDHLYPGDLAMRGPWFANNIDPEPFTVYGNDALIRRLEETCSDPETRKQLEGVVEIRELKAFETAEIEGYHVTPVLAGHNPRENCYLYLVEKDTKRLFYANDTGCLPEKTWEYLKAEKPIMDLVSLDCTNLVLPGGKSHMGIRECLETRDKLIEIGCADAKTKFVINHFSHNGCIAKDGALYLHEELEILMAKENFQVSYDGKTIEF